MKHPGLRVAQFGRQFSVLRPSRGQLLSIIASGISSSTVGTMAGQMIMQGFVGFRIPIWLRASSP